MAKHDPCEQVITNTQSVKDVKEVFVDFRDETRTHRKDDRKRLDRIYYIALVGSGAGILDLFTQAGPVSSLIGFISNLFT